MSKFALMKNDLSIIPLTTVLAYGMSYFYQLGVADYYGYPSVFIVNDLNSFFNATLGLGLFIFISLFIILLLSWANKSNKGAWLPLSILIISYSATYLFFVGFNRPSSIFPDDGSITILTVMTFIFWPINYFNIYSAVINRKKSIEAKEYLSGKVTFYDMKIDYQYLTKNQIIIFASLFIIMILSISYSSGKVYSYIKNDLYVLQNEENVFMLNSFSDRIIFGACTKDGVKYIQTKNDEKITISLISNQSELKKIKRCFELRGKLTSQNNDTANNHKNK